MSGDIRYVRCLKCLKILQCSRYDSSALIDHVRNDHPEIEIVETESQLKERLGFGSGEYVRNSGGGFTGLQTRCKPNDAEPIRTCDSKRMSFIAERGSGTEINKCRRRGRHPSPEDKMEFSDDVYRNGESDDQRKKHRGRNGCSKNAGAKVIYTRHYRVNTPPPVEKSPRQATPPPIKKARYRTSIEKWRPANGTIYCPSCGTTGRPMIKTRAERFSDNSCMASCIFGCWPFCFLPYLCPGYNREYLYCACCKTFLGLYDRDDNCVKPNREYAEFPDNDKMK